MRSISRSFSVKTRSIIAVEARTVAKWVCAAITSTKKSLRARRGSALDEKNVKDGTPGGGHTPAFSGAARSAIGRD